MSNTEKTYNFNEKKVEKIWVKDEKAFKEFEVWQSPKYLESKAKAIEIIESGQYGVTVADFWILMNATKNGKMAYTGLIISHNGCLKINDALPVEQRFKPSSLKRDLSPYGNSLIYEYSNDEQGIYEVGEVSAKNCANDYPFAMALKRCFDRVVLKISKLAYAGIYSDSEADEFKDPQTASENTETPKVDTKEKVNKSGAKVIKDKKDAAKVVAELPKDYKFLSGKYAGKTIAEVYESDAAYLSDILAAKGVSTTLKKTITDFLETYKEA